MHRWKMVFVLLAVFNWGTVYGEAVAAGSANGMTLNGATGLILVPDARIGWENASMGVDAGYGFVWNGGSHVEHLPRLSLSLFGRVELSTLFQIDQGSLENGVLGAKFQLYRDSGTVLALGTDWEFSPSKKDSGKLYLAVTYGGDFFRLPAVTSAVMGWQYWENGRISSQFIYGMGFSLSLLPDTLRDFLYWVTDFSNFSYAMHGASVSAEVRGAFNTGLRIHPIKDGPFNMVIDLIGTDLLDQGRGLSATVSGGWAFQ